MCISIGDNVMPTEMRRITNYFLATKKNFCQDITNNMNLQ